MSLYCLFFSFYLFCQKSFYLLYYLFFLQMSLCFTWRGAAGVGFCSLGISSPYFLIACTPRRVWEKQKKKTRREREKETEVGDKDASEIPRSAIVCVCVCVFVCVRAYACMWERNDSIFPDDSCVEAVCVLSFIIWRACLLEHTHIFIVTLNREGRGEEAFY